MSRSSEIALRSSRFSPSDRASDPPARPWAEDGVESSTTAWQPVVAWIVAILMVSLLLRESATSWPLSAAGAVHGVWRYCKAVADVTAAANYGSVLVAGMTMILAALSTAAMLLAFAG